MAKVKLRNVNPLGDIWVRGFTVPAGDTFDVDADVAGRAPSGWKVVDNDADERPADHLTRPVVDEATGLQALDEQGRPVVEAYDPGEGLLAQTGNFERASSSKASDDKSTPADKA